MVSVTNSRILRSHELAERLGVSRVTLWRWERKGLLPRRIQIGPNTAGWLESEIDAWWKAKASGATGSEAR
jgi:prophage regulatory protein